MLRSMFRRFAGLALGLLVAAGLAGCERRSTPAAPPAPASPPGSGASAATPGAPTEEFLRLMNAGKNFLDQGDATNAVAIYRKAGALVPGDLDVHLNLANAHLLGEAPADALREVDEVLRREPNSAAAWFLKGSAHLRRSEWEAAAIALQNALQIEPGETATFFQLGRARMELKQWEAAITAFRDGLAIDPNHLHATAHFLLGQALMQAGRADEAQEEMRLHQAGLESGGPPASISLFERSRYTQARVPFVLEQPDPTGIPVGFPDATPEAFGGKAASYSAPVAVLDVDHSGRSGLFVLEPGAGFRRLLNEEGVLRPGDPVLPVAPGARYERVLAGDLQNDRFEDVLVLGDSEIRVYRFETNGVVTDVSGESGLGAVRAVDGLLVDLDFTGKLDLVAVGAATGDLRVQRQSVPFRFGDVTGTSGIPETLKDARAVAIEDWNRDGHMDLVVSRREGPPMLLEKRRGGTLVTRQPTNWVAGTVFVTGDFDNDLRPDLAIAVPGRVTLCFNGGGTRTLDLPAGFEPRRLVAVDHDNDGWLDLWAGGQGIRAWRNRGLSGFEDHTDRLGLDRFGDAAVADLVFADFDLDCDSDAVVALRDGGLRYLRNEGANANAQVKVRLFGNRSNASGLGCQVEIESGGLRLMRTVQRLPVEVGVGKAAKLDSFLVHWLNWPQGSADVPVDCREPLLALEMSIQEGSCPYLYAWDGTRFRFVTDVLGAAPLGLPVAKDRYVEADPEEWVWVGAERDVPARDGKLQLRITEELREVLYLDEAKLAVVDHQVGTEVHPTDKLLPSGPYSPGSLVTLHHEHPLQQATDLEGRDVTPALRAVDGRRVSPPRLRAPQLRGLAESHGWVLDFGPLDVRRPLVLVLNGWLRFGGGMANIAASHDPSLPFPFPTLEAEIEPGVWKAVDVTVGAPAGKTKTILVDLDGRLAPGTRRLRLNTAYEIHWDRIALLEKQPAPATRQVLLKPGVADLHFRGFSPPLDLPPDCPITPDYETVSTNSCWTILPGGWCTRYGDVRELVGTRDEGLALIHSGDELSLDFEVGSLPARPEGWVREYFLFVDGWDKDSDFHVAAGTEVGPLPYHGQRDQCYGRPGEVRPAFPSDALHQAYNTRWVESRALKQAASRGRGNDYPLPRSNRRSASP